MKYDAIRVGMILRLKKSRQEAYGMDSGFVTVIRLKFRKGYKVPHVETNHGFFRPEDFRSDYAYELPSVSTVDEQLANATPCWIHPPESL